MSLKSVQSQFSSWFVYRLIFLCLFPQNIRLHLLPWFFHPLDSALSVRLLSSSGLAVPSCLYLFTVKSTSILLSDSCFPSHVFSSRVFILKDEIWILSRSLSLLLNSFPCSLVKLPVWFLFFCCFCFVLCTIGLSPNQNGLIKYRSKVRLLCNTEFYLLDHFLFVLYKLLGFLSCPWG